MKSVVFLGDICAHGYCDTDVNEFHKTKLFKYLTNKDNVVVGNLEAPILSEEITTNDNKFSLLNPPVNASFFDFCSVLSLANNHIFDQGWEGFERTVLHLENFGIRSLGAGGNLLLSRRPQKVTVCGIDIFLLAYNCYSTNSANNADFSSFGTAPLLLDFISDDVNSIRKSNCDAKIIVLPHWGIENEFLPTIEQTAFARKIIDMGVDALIGTHTHTIQAKETYNDKPIYYSLGNFLFNDFSISDSQTYYQSLFNKEGMIVELKIIDGQLHFFDKYIKMNQCNIPDIVSEDALDTPVSKNNDLLSQYTNDCNYKNSKPDLSLSLVYNGRSAQIVYASPTISHNARLIYETTRVKFKRLIIYRLRKLLK